MPEKVAEAHQNGDFYIRDLSWYGKTMTCLQIPLSELMEKGFNNGHGYIRPPKGVKTAAALAAIILQSNQNDQHGGQSYAYFDRDMGIFVEKEYERQKRMIKDSMEKAGVVITEEQLQNLVESRVQDEAYQAMEGFIYNLNTMHQPGWSSSSFFFN